MAAKAAAKLVGPTDPGFCEREVRAECPAQFAKSGFKVFTLTEGVVGGRYARRGNPDAGHARRLRVRDERRGENRSEASHERAAVHSIT